MRADERRTQRLRANGYRVIRFSNEEVLGDPDRVLKEIARSMMSSAAFVHIALDESRDGEDPAERDTEVVAARSPSRQI